MLKISMFATLMLVVMPPAFAEEASIVETFIGDWVSEGDAFGGPASSTMVWSSALEGAFTRLDYRIEMNPEAPNPSVFAGVAYYKKVDEGAYKAYWADSNGDLHPVIAVHDDDALLVDWGVAGAKQGRTRYELVADDKMRVTDWLLTDDGWRQFNQNDFMRSDPEAN